MQYQQDEIDAIKRETDIELLKAYTLSVILYGSFSNRYNDWRAIADKDCTDLTNKEVESANFDALSKAILRRYEE